MQVFEAAYTLIFDFTEIKTIISYDGKKNKRD
jgi:hypothetical protein